MLPGITALLARPDLLARLRGQRLALLGHPASLTAAGEHSLDALRATPGLELVAAFGPQHGMRGDKQDNMIESPDYRDPLHGIPVFSLYGEVRRPTAAMLATFDVLLVAGGALAGGLPLGVVHARPRRDRRPKDRSSSSRKTGR